MANKTLWRRVHRYMGLAIGIFLVITGLTGSVLAFHQEIDAWLNPKLLTHSQPYNAKRPFSELEAKLHAQYPNAQVIGWQFPAFEQLNINAIVHIEEEATTLPGSHIYLNPYTAEITGGRSPGNWQFDLPHLLPFIYRLHYTLHLPNLALGKFILGLAALIWLLDCFVSFYITLPSRRPLFSRWSKALKINWRASWKRINFDAHIALGLMFWLVLVLMALSSVKLNLNQLVFTPVVEVFSSVTPSPLLTIPPPEVTGNDTPAPRVAVSVADNSLFPSGFQQAIQTTKTLADSQHQLRSIFYHPKQNAYSVLYKPKPELHSYSLQQSKYFVDKHTLRVLATQDYEQSTNGDKFLAWQYPIHSGKIIGLSGKALVCFSGLLVTFLSISGLIIWLRKGRKINSP